MEHSAIVFVDQPQTITPELQASYALPLSSQSACLIFESCQAATSFNALI